MDGLCLQKTAPGKALDIEAQVGFPAEQYSMLASVIAGKVLYLVSSVCYSNRNCVFVCLFLPFLGLCLMLIRNLSL